MKQADPPSLAAWMLEHLTPSNRDEAVAGDLLEVFRSGRSRSWYWRQVLAACALAWFRSLRERMPMLIFALLWSTLAPAWAALLARIGDSPRVAEALRLSWPLALAWWTALNTVFLWTGMLLYIVAHGDFTKTLRRQSIGSAFFWGPVILLPAYAATFVLTNLLWYPGLGGFHSTAPLAEIADLRTWALVLRMPYLIALAAALWRVVPQSGRASKLHLADSTPLEFSAQSEALALPLTLDLFTTGRFFAFTVAAGLVNAMLASIVLLLLPDAHAPSLASLCVRAVLYVACGALAGVAGSWFYWSNPASPFRENPPLPFPLFAMVCCAAWVWIPSMVLFYEQVSAVTAFVAMVGAFVLASGLRSATRSIFAPALHAPLLWEHDRAELFAESLYCPPWDARGYGIAIALYVAGWALTRHSNYTAALFLASSAFLFAWERSAPQDRTYEHRGEYKRSAMRLACTIVPAMLFTFWALLNGVGLREQALAAQAAQLHPGTKDAKHHDSAAISSGLSGYESIILWPVAGKRKVIAPVPPGPSLLVKGAKQPLILRFNGEYWYFQPPDKRPGAEAHRGYGTPLVANIRSNNGLPLVMEARQNLASPILVANCREIRVEIENRNNTFGPIAMAVLLANSSTSGKPALYLGRQLVLSGQQEQMAGQLLDHEEALRFFVPTTANLRAFDTITVMFFPEAGSFRTAPQIAIDQFSLIPR